MTHLVADRWVGVVLGLVLLIGAVPNRDFASAESASAPPRLTSSPGKSLHRGDRDRPRVTKAIRKGAQWLLAQQDASGAFLPRARIDACPVALTALALRALVESDPAVLTNGSVDRAIAYLRSYRQPDGGIYDPERGLAVYTSGVVASALRAVSKWDEPGSRHEVDPGSPDGDEPSAHVRELLPDLDLFVYRRGIPESLMDADRERDTGSLKSAQLLDELIQEKEGLSADESAAVEFLDRNKTTVQETSPFRTRSPRWKRSDGGTDTFTYEDLLPLIYKSIRADYPEAVRALRTIESFYTLERNPDLTKRYGEGGFLPGTQGLFYYYHTIAKVLSVRGSPTLEVSSGRTRGRTRGRTHDWAHELEKKLLGLQRREGWWANRDGRWWEDEPVLVTSYALMTLNMCRDVRRTVPMRGLNNAR